MPPAEKRQIEQPEPHGPIKPQPHIPDGQPNPYFAPHRDKLARLRAECVEQTFVGRNVEAATAEWKSLPADTRLFLLVFAGVDDANTMLAKDWREIPVPERLRICALITDLRRQLRPLFALTV